MERTIGRQNRGTTYIEMKKHSSSHADNVAIRQYLLHYSALQLKGEFKDSVHAFTPTMHSL